MNWKKDTIYPETIRICMVFLFLTVGIILPSGTAGLMDGDAVYTCPMHPEILREQPGSCPICGMDLVEAADRELHTPDFDVLIDPVVVQNMGVRLEHVKRGSIHRDVRALGEVEVAEDEISVVNLRYSGWIEKIYVDETGQEVKKGDPLFSIYSPDLVATLKEYLLAVNTRGADSEFARSAAGRLNFWNIPESVLKRVIKNQTVDRTLTIISPGSGYILHKDVVEGTKVNEGRDLYRIGNLKKIWVAAEVYEFDAPWIRIGQKADMELPFQQGRHWDGVVSTIYPTLNKISRTLTVRLEYQNPGVELKPGMFATVRIHAQEKDNALVIPTEAIIRSGERQIVFVAKELGRYEPREIITGLTGSGHISEVLSGLTEGEAVVISGQFLLDSESQLQEAIRKFTASGLQVGRPVPEKASHEQMQLEYAAMDAPEAVYTCPMHSQIVQSEPGNCPICRMELVERTR
ncbi:efflux RND transporter periplasmic adaptor subunit [bacterium]|nr:efflux RND transporter periplasmic adaptor subunit [candidate division CSSED10-310 bacterium]